MTSSRILALVGVPVGVATLAWSARQGARRLSSTMSILDGADLTDLVDAERAGAARLLALVDRQRQRLAAQEGRLDHHDERLASVERRHLWRDWWLEDLEDRLSAIERVVEGCSYCAEVRDLLEATGDGSGRVVTPPLRRAP